MHLIQLRRPLQRVAASSCRQFAPVLRPTTTFSERFAQLRINSPTCGAAVEGRRYASVKSQGAYKITNKKTLPKKLGAKKTGDQYVIPGNIIYKQRGTIWHPGENTIMGRDHTIHSAIAGYVKYYRDPQRHPKRQYIGIVYNKEDKLPYPVGMARKRKVGLVPTVRKEIVVDQDAIGPSGIPYSVTRHEEIDVAPLMEGGSSKKRAALLADEEPTVFTNGNSVIAALIKQKIRSRQQQEVKKEELRLRLEEELTARKGTRILRLQKDYSYRESNWEIGRLVGDPGTIAGTEKVWSRKAKLRARRKKRNLHFLDYKTRALAKNDRRIQYKKFVWDKRIKMAAARAERATADIEKKAAAAVANEAKTKESKTKDPNKTDTKETKA
ncbi:ribosomal L27 protein-domain-containing protein [Lasiosphaeria hispida]|uniref:Large ribosomal subunit protein bL27m n=1 Tax=Lasiosphaeria hispida TaxID=260671 RepID=A0AAJ0HS10_9PEZI|nr:ribosomal L27 protein-domain-containing protein [Lasiosphaeria hispida]